jgi:osmotically-inducible protein OsmY
MQSSCAERKLRILAVCCLIAGGLVGFAPSAAAATDQEVADHVQAALQSDEYFYGAHVTVSVDGGSVVLNGFVFSDWDLRDAVRIARGAAGGRRVVDNLSIKVGGRR